MASKKSRFIQQQKIALGIVLALVAAVMVYLFSQVVTDIPDGEFVEGEHFLLLDNPRRVRGDKIEVMEFFSYGCVHCYNLDDELQEWASERTDVANLIRTPAIANETWRTYGRAYYAMEELGLLDERHSVVFKQIHGARRNLTSNEDFASVIATGKVTEAQVISAMNSADTNQKLVRADNLARRFKIATVPSLVVNGKYHVRANSNIGLSRMLDVVDYLIARENSTTKASSADPSD